MADEFKSIRDNLFKVLTGFTVNVNSASDQTPDLSDDDEDGARSSGRSRAAMDASAARALIAALFTKAGKGKDEIVQIVAREIGTAVAHMMKEPLSQLAKHQKLQISFEFVPKDKVSEAVRSLPTSRDHAPIPDGRRRAKSNKKSVRTGQEHGKSRRS